MVRKNGLKTVSSAFRSFLDVSVFYMSGLGKFLKTSGWFQVARAHSRENFTFQSRRGPLNSAATLNQAREKSNLVYPKFP